MPSMIVSRASRSGKPSVSSTTMGVFTGQVWIDSVLSGDGMSVGNVNFSPCARTNWHTHEKGQLIRVTAGAGWVCDKGSKPVKINVGDVIWCPPGSEHWHGADDESYMVHQVTTFGGVEWGDPVGDEEYAAKK